MDDGLQWPLLPSTDFAWSLRVPPALVPTALGRLDPEWSYVGQLLVGDIAIGAATLDGMSDLRAWAESAGGSLVLVKAPPDTYDVVDPWGTPPSTLQLQSRLIASFDPNRVINPGRLPGGI